MSTMVSEGRSLPGQSSPAQAHAREKKKKTHSKGGEASGHGV